MTSDSYSLLCYTETIIPYSKSLRRVYEQIDLHLKYYPASPDQKALQAPLGEILLKNTLTLRFLDLPAQNTAHWAKKEKVLLDLEMEFRLEGSDFLFHNRLSECQGNMSDLKRYLYIIPKE